MASFKAEHALEAGELARRFCQGSVRLAPFLNH